MCEFTTNGALIVLRFPTIDTVALLPSPEFVDGLASFMVQVLLCFVCSVDVLNYVSLTQESSFDPSML